MALCGKERKRLLDRLNRIEGQVRGIRAMIQEDRDCFDVLKQIAAASGALRALGLVVLEDHLKGCVTDAIRTRRGGEALLDEVLDVFKRFHGGAR